MQHTLLWHGHSNFQLTTPGMSLVIDPFFDGNPSAKTAAADIAPPDLVLVTHDHGDHVGQALEICRKTGASLLANVETAGRLAEEGLPKAQIVNSIGINIGGTIEFKGIKATMVQAFHSSATGSAVGYILTLEDGFTVYHAGDTGLFASMELFGKLFDIDLALLPIGGVFTMDPRMAAMACRLLKARSVVPMHWGTFPALETSTDPFARELATHSPETRLFSMRPGQRLAIGRSAPPDTCPSD